SRVLKRALDKMICKPDDMSYWVSLLVLPLCLLKTFVPMSNLECGSLQLVRETLAELSPQWFDIDEDGIDLSESNIKQCKRKICDGQNEKITGIRTRQDTGRVSPIIIIQ
nr:hypothetical protein [Tanacetum cinerariifolium]